MSSQRTQLVANNTRQAFKVRALTIVFGALALAACAWAVRTALSDTPDAAAFILAPFGVATACGLVLYARRYVVAMWLAQDALVLRTAFRSDALRIALTRVGARTQHEGRLHLADAPSVHAPWITLRVAGYRVPFVIDLQAEQVDTKRIANLGKR